MGQARELIEEAAPAEQPAVPAHALSPHIVPGRVRVGISVELGGPPEHIDPFELSRPVGSEQRPHAAAMPADVAAALAALALVNADTPIAILARRIAAAQLSAPAVRWPRFQPTSVTREAELGVSRPAEIAKAALHLTLPLEVDAMPRAAREALAALALVNASTPEAILVRRIAAAQLSAPAVRWSRIEPVLPTDDVERAFSRPTRVAEVESPPTHPLETGALPRAARDALAALALVDADTSAPSVARRVAAAQPSASAVRWPRLRAIDVARDPKHESGETAPAQAGAVSSNAVSPFGARALSHETGAGFALSEPPADDTPDTVAPPSIVERWTDVSTPPSMPLGDDVRPTGIMQPLSAAAGQAAPPRPGQIEGDSASPLDSAFPPSGADRLSGADLSTSSAWPQPSDAPVSRLVSPSQDRVPASARAGTAEAEAWEPRPTPIGLTSHELAMAHIERQRAAVGPAAFEAPIAIEAVVPNVSMEWARAIHPPRAAAEDRATNTISGTSVEVVVPPRQTAVETATPVVAIHPVGVAKDRADAVPPSAAQAIDRPQGGASTSPKLAAIPVPRSRTSALPVTSMGNVEPPAWPAQVDEAPLPSSMSSIDRTSPRSSASPGVLSSPSALSPKVGIAVHPEAPKATSPSIHQTSIAAATQPLPVDMMDSISTDVRPVQLMRPASPSAAAPPSPAAPTPAAVSPGLGTTTSPEKLHWDPGHLPSSKRRLAGRFASYLDEHRDKMSHAARIASMRKALGPDAAPLEGWIMLRIAAAGRGHAEARVFLDRLISLGAKLVRDTHKETIGKEDEEIRRLGGSPVAVQPPWDPHQGDHAGRFLSGAFLTARSIGRAELERAVIFANAKRYRETSAWSTHLMRRVWVWANSDTPKAKAFRDSQPRQDRLSQYPPVTWDRWLEILSREYRSATGKDLFDGRGMTD